MSQARPQRLGIIGCGAIGSTVARLLEKRRSSFRITSLFDLAPGPASRLSQNLKSRPRVFEKLSDVISHSDFILEAASVKAVPAVIRAALPRKKPVMVMSTGGFLFHQKEITRLANRYRTKVYLPSGALAGLDV